MKDAVSQGKPVLIIVVVMWPVTESVALQEKYAQVKVAVILA